VRTVKHWLKRAAGVHSLPPVEDVADARWYDSAYRATPSYAEPYWYTRYYSLWALMADRLRSARVNSVLDIGCGPGQFAACLFEMSAIASYVGLDFSAATLAMAKRACPQGRFVLGDARLTNLHTEVPHDVTICTEVLEHIPDDLAVLSRFSGRCLCTVPNFPYMSHVRHFPTADDVSARYGPFFSQYDVLAVRAQRSRTDIYFLLDGVRNSRVL
jgi:SAM-dependent methyltransferase